MDGHGTSINFGTSGFSARLISVDGPDMKRESIDETYMDTTVAKDWDPAALFDMGEVSLTVKHDPALEPPIDGDNETITITFKSGKGMSFLGHMTGYAGGASIGARMEAKVTIKASGGPTYF